MRRHWSIAAFAVLLFVLAGTSSLRTVGDGDEYVRITERARDLRSPGGVSRHFWLYPALAAPLVALCSRVRLDPLAGYTLLNGLCLVLAFAVLRRRVSGAVLVLLMLSPILWWLDKAHPEAFTYALLVVGFATLHDGPWWTFVTFGMAAAQNSALAPAVPIVVLASLGANRAMLGRRRWWTGLVAGALMPVVAAVSNLRLHGTVTPLLAPGMYHVPRVGEIGALLWDPNLGLLVNFPLLAPAVLVAAVTLARARPGRSTTVELAAAAAAALAFLVGASQAINVNHGATPDLSRYATWLVPASIALFAAVRSLPAGRLAPRAMVLLAAAGAAWSLTFYHPRLPERVGQPSRLAVWLWTRFPSLDNPLPEVFTERLSGADEDWLPVATAGCEKILLVGRARHDGMWPIPCPPAPLPPACEEAGRLCYANRTDRGYRFVVLPKGHDAYRFRRERTWPRMAEPVVAHVFAQAALPARPGLPTWVQRVDGVAEVSGLQGPDSLVAYLTGLADEAAVTILAPATMSGAFIVPGTGEEAARFAVPAGPSRVPVPAGLPDCLLLLAREPG